MWHGGLRGTLRIVGNSAGATPITVLATTEITAMRRVPLSPSWNM